VVFDKGARRGGRGGGNDRFVEAGAGDGSPGVHILKHRLSEREPGRVGDGSRGPFAIRAEHIRSHSLDHIVT